MTRATTKANNIAPTQILNGHFADGLLVRRQPCGTRSRNLDPMSGQRPQTAHSATPLNRCVVAMLRSDRSWGEARMMGQRTGRVRRATPSRQLAPQSVNGCESQLLATTWNRPTSNRPHTARSVLTSHAIFPADSGRSVIQTHVFKDFAGLDGEALRSPKSTRASSARK
jgi:hypothetical protein